MGKKAAKYNNGGFGSENDFTTKTRQGLDSRPRPRSDAPLVLLAILRVAPGAVFHTGLGELTCRWHLRHADGLREPTGLAPGGR